MKKRINIYVEGKGDIAFIGQYLTKLFDIDFEYNLEKLRAKSTSKGQWSVELHGLDSASSHGGIDEKKLTTLKKEIQNINEPIGVESVIIIDADTKNHKGPDGGYEKRSEFMLNLYKDTNASIFLFPDHENDGRLEDLLDKLISKKGEPFYNCLKGYIQCLSKLAPENTPAEIVENPDLDKKKMEWYSYMMLGRFANKKQNELYLKPELWNLDCAALSALKSFFLTILN